MLVWGFTSHSRIFNSYADVTITAEELHFDLCSTFIAIEQWWFFSVSRLLWHRASVCSAHLWGPLTLTPVAEHLAVELSQPVFTTYVYRGWVLNTKPSAYEANGVTDYAIAAVQHCHSIRTAWIYLITWNHFSPCVWIQWRVFIFLGFIFFLFDNRK